MFIFNDFIHPADLVCTEPVNDDLNHTHFQYFDKDGFELNKAEQAYYTANDYYITANFLNKPAWMCDWISKDSSDVWKSRFVLDHSFTTYRCNYRGKAHDQIKNYAKNSPEAKWLLQIRPKWGFDFDLGAINKDGNIFELLHVEYDTYFYRDFNETRKSVEDKILNMDWDKAADEVWDRREEWCLLPGYKQNDWKANLLLGWEFCEYIEKAVKV